MAFCTKCGQQMANDIQFCTACGEAVAAAPAATEATPAAPVAQPMPVAAAPAVAAAPNPIFTDALAAVKQVFSPNPDNSVTTAMNSKAHVWVILGGLFILLYGLFFRQWFNSFMQDRLSAMMGGFGGMIDQRELSMLMGPILNQIFTSMLLMAAVYFFALCGAMKLVYVLLKVDISFVKVMNLVGGALLMMIVGLAVGFLVTFVHTWAGVGVAAIGSLGSMLMLYTGVKNSAQFKVSPLWAFLAMYTAAIIVTIIVMNISGQGIGADMMGGGMDMFW